MRIGVQVADVGSKPVVDDPCLDSGFLARRRQRCGLAIPSQGFGQECREQDRAAGSQQGLLQDALKLPDVARPAVAAKALQRLRGELAYFPPQLTAVAPKVALHQERQGVAPGWQRS